MTPEASSSNHEITVTTGPGRRAAKALVAVGVGHLVAGIVVAWLGRTLEFRMPGGPARPAELASVLLAGLLAAGTLVVASRVAARACGHQRPWRRASLAVAGLVTGGLAGVVLATGVELVTGLGAGAFPIVGAGFGVQLAVVLPAAGVGRTAVRVLVPVVVDVIAGSTWHPASAAGVPEVALAVGWMLIALIGVGAMEDRRSA